MPPLNCPLLVSLASALASVALEVPASAATQPEPRPHSLDLRDARLELSVRASDPDIRTPIGLAIDKHDRLFVLESHTHMPPAGYEGPDSDFIKVFSDTNDDGAMDETSVFARGLEDGMNIAFSPEGVLYVVEKKAVWALYDRDNDGISDDREQVLTMTKPDDVYDHASLMGIAFSDDGWMYVTRGNVGGSYWRMAGTDGSELEGYGDGGNIMRSRPDGSELQEVATGFWNPFDVKIDGAGRVLATDNDPDSRGPNRLLHIVQGGDYGYKSLYGGSGIHPYLAWNGELPGTLPYIAGLGESPTALLVADQAALPGDYANSVLVAIWEESNIVRVDLTPSGASLHGSVETLIQGGPDFRPVAFAVDSQGAVYFTDWVIRAYPNHGRGRIWKLTAKGETMKPGTMRAEAEGPPPMTQESLEAVYQMDDPDDFDRLIEKAASDDPFVATAARSALENAVYRQELSKATKHPDANTRLASLLTLMGSGADVGPEIVRPLLADADLRVRKMALVWAGRRGMTSLRDELYAALAGPRVTADLFETYLETARHLNLDFIEGMRKRIRRDHLTKVGESAEIVADLLKDPEAPETVLVSALRFLEEPSDHFDLVAAFARDARRPEVRLEAVRTISRMSHKNTKSLLLALAQSHDNPPDIRAEAILGLSQSATGLASEVAELLDDPHPEVRLEAARLLRVQRPDEVALGRAKEVFEALRNPAQDRMGQQLALLLKPAEVAGRRPKSTADWQTAIASGGDPEIGRRVFSSPLSQCLSCHAVDKVGGLIGPNLTQVGASKSREQLVLAILEPSAEIAPDWQGWYVKTHDGVTHYGRQIDVGEGSVKLMTLSGKFQRYSSVESYGVAASSLMPAGLERRLTEHDLRDLIAYLEALR